MRGENEADGPAVRRSASRNSVVRRLVVRSAAAVSAASSPSVTRHRDDANIIRSNPVVRTGRPPGESDREAAPSNITPVDADDPEAYDDYYGSKPVHVLPAVASSAASGAAGADQPIPVPPRTAASREARTRVSLLPPAIEVTGLSKSFDGTLAVDDVTFSVAAGSVLALLGPNGAGKTTTVNMLTTLMKADSGSAHVAGFDVASDGAQVRRRIAVTGQFAALDESLTGRENLVLFGRLQGLGKRDAQRRADDLLVAFDLVDAGRKRVADYSGGMRRRVDLACSLVTSPEVVFLDEPTTGLDPRSRQEVWALVKRLREQGVTILLTTQYLEEADLLSDDIVVIDHGRVVAAGTAEQLKAQTGGTYCEVTPADLADLDRLGALLADLTGTAGRRDEVSLSVPAPTGTDVLVEIVKRTSDAGIVLADISMRNPSLDDVFLALTGTSRSPGAH